jgi:hypothetical protein
MTKINLTELQNYFNERMYGFDAKIFGIAWNSNQNVLLTGPGGYGKTYSAQLFYDFLVHKGIFPEGSKPFVQSLNPDTTTEKIFGGTNIKEFTENGAMVYNCHNSFANAPFVIFEEFLDAPSSSLMALKDALTSGYVRDGLYTYEVKTKMIIACTNLSADEFAEDDATQALLERFRFQMVVRWNGHTEDDYIKSYEIATGNKGDDIIVKAVANAAAASYGVGGDRPVSPRTYMTAVEACKGCDKDIDPLTPLYYMDYPGGFKPAAVKTASANLAALRKVMEDLERLANYQSMWDTYKENFKTTAKTINEENLIKLYNMAAKLKETLSEVSLIKVTDNALPNYRKLLSSYKSLYTSWYEFIANKVKEDPSITNENLLKLSNSSVERYEFN